MGWNESEIAGLIIYAISVILRPRKLGKVLAPDGMQRLVPGLIRVPDVSYFARGKLTRSKHGRRRRALVGDLVVEVVSKSNTKAEIARSSPSISPPAAGLPGSSSPSLKPSGCTLRRRVCRSRPG